MYLIRVLVALHPRDWRERYGAEFAALLEDTRLAPSAIADVAVQATGCDCGAPRPAAAGYRRPSLGDL